MEKEDRLTRIDKCLSTLTHEFMRVARVEDDVEGFFTSKNELHLILSNMAREETDSAGPDLLEACKGVMDYFFPDGCYDVSAMGLHRKLIQAISRAEGKEGEK